MQHLSDQIENLYQTRYHGAVNIRGIRYQLLYSAISLFKLYQDTAPESICFEGIEDIDINGVQKLEINSIKIANQYIQLKSSKNSWYWSTFKNAGILENFLDVWKINNFADFWIVTNFGFNDELNQLVHFCHDKSHNLPNKIKSQIQTILGKKGLKKDSLEPFLKRVNFKEITEDDLLIQIRENIVETF